jgi:hypothetical protein
MRARWYDPGSGRFLSVDPLIRLSGDSGSSNPYSYAGNNPLNGVDPTGEWTLYLTRPDPNFSSSASVHLFDSHVDLRDLGHGGGRGALGGFASSSEVEADTASEHSSRLGSGPNVSGEGETEFVESGLFPRDDSSAFAGQEYVVAQLLSAERSKLGSTSTTTQALAGGFGLGAAYVAIGVSGLEVAKASLQAAAAAATIRSAAGFTVRQALLAGIVAGPAAVLGVAAGLYIAGFALENGIRLYNERSGSHIRTPNAILGREFFPVVR